MMHRKLLIVVPLAVILGAFGFLGVKHITWKAGMAEKVDSAHTISRVGGYFSVPESSGLLDVMGISLLSDKEQIAYRVYSISIPVFNQEEVNREDLEKLVEAYNSDPSNTAKITTDDILVSLRSDFIAELLDCDGAYSPSVQPFLFIDWCMNNADVVYIQDVLAETENATQLPFQAGDSVYQWRGDYMVDPVIIDGKVQEFATFRTFTNFDYVIHGDELFSAETAFRWEYEANQKEN